MNYKIKDGDCMGKTPETGIAVLHTKYQCSWHTGHQSQLTSLQVHSHPYIHCTLYLFYSVVHTFSHVFPI